MQDELKKKKKEDKEEEDLPCINMEEEKEEDSLVPPPATVDNQLPKGPASLPIVPEEDSLVPLPADHGDSFRYVTNPTLPSFLSIDWNEGRVGFVLL